MYTTTDTQIPIILIWLSKLNIDPKVHGLVLLNNYLKQIESMLTYVEFMMVSNSFYNELLYSAIDIRRKYRNMFIVHVQR